MEKFMYFSIVVSFAAFLFAGWLYNWVKAAVFQQPGCGSRAADSKRRQHVPAQGVCGPGSFRGCGCRPYSCVSAQPGVERQLDQQYNHGGGLRCGYGFLSHCRQNRDADIHYCKRKVGRSRPKGIKPSFLAGFRGGAVMGMAVVGASLLVFRPLCL